MSQSIYDNPSGMRQPNTTSILGGIGGGNIEQLLTMFGPMIAGMMGVKGLGGGTFGSFGDFSSLQAMEQQRRFMQMTMQSKLSQEMQNADLMHIRSMLTGGASMLGISMSESDMLTATGFLSNPMMMGMLQMSAPKVAGMLFPNAGSAFTSAQSLYRGGFGSYMTPGMISGYNEGFLRGGGYDPSNPLLSVDPALAQGFMSSERASISSGLAARGLISVDRTGVSAADLDAILSGDEAKAKEVGMRVSARTNAQLKEFVPAYGFAKSVFGAEMPNMSESQVGDLLDSITGGLGGMNKGEMMTQIARIKEITETLPITATAVKNFIDSVVGLGNQVGMTGAMSAKIAVSALASGQGMAAARINMFGNAPGMGMYGSDWFADQTVNRQMNAAKASLPGDIGLLLDLGAGGNVAGLSGGDRAIFEAAQRRASGDYSTEDFALLRNTSREKFMAVAQRMSGQNSNAIRSLFQSDAARQESLRRNPGVLSGMEYDQVTDTFLAIKSSGALDSFFTAGTSSDDMMLALSALEGNGQGGVLNIGGIKNILGDKFNTIFRNNSSAALGNLRGTAMGYGWNKDLSALYSSAVNPERRAKDKRRNNRAKYAARMQGILGGTNPLERLVQGIENGDMWKAIGFYDTSEVLGTLANNDEYLNAISNTQDEDEFLAGVDSAVSIIPDADKAKKFREDALRIRKISSGNDRKNQLKTLLKGQGMTDDERYAAFYNNAMEQEKKDAEERDAAKDAEKNKSAANLNREELGTTIRNSINGITIRIVDDSGVVITDEKIT